MPASQKPPAQHASIEALLAAHPGERDAKKVIRNLARARVAYAKSHGWQGPPFCPKELASIFGIRCKEVAHDIGGDGRILVQRDGKPIIEYRGGRIPERQRFTIFHEFAHTLFPDYCAFAAHHHAPESQIAPEDREFEFLCDLAAAEMLLPCEEFSRDLQQLSPACFETIHNLRRRYESSIDATTYRLVELETRSICAAVFLTDQRKKDFAGTGPLWVNNSSRHSSFRTFIWPGTVPPADSVVVRCYRSGNDTTQAARETWWIKGEPRSWVVQATKLPVIPENPAYPKIAALLVANASQARAKAK